MNFNRSHRRDEPEINFIPLIDVLLVILIFLMVSTTYSKVSDLSIQLPSVSSGATISNDIFQIDVAISESGAIHLNGQSIKFNNVKELSEALANLAKGKKEPVIVIQADAKATHQSVINVMEAARLANLTQLTFATEIKS